jgi:hypothetical protein
LGVKIIAPACSASIFTPRECVSIKILTFFIFGLWRHVKCATQAVQLQNFQLLHVQKILFPCAKISAPMCKIFAPPLIWIGFGFSRRVLVSTFFGFSKVTVSVQFLLFSVLVSVS